MACPTKGTLLIGKGSPKRRVPAVNLNPAPPSLMHIDINSCFATLEQQANPLLRGVPLAVAAYNKAFGCILASSYEAKLWGVKTGMTVEEGKRRCPMLVVRETDSNKYRFVHTEIRHILDSYSDKVIPKSIDEYVLPIQGSNPRKIASEIKKRIKREVGEWITVSIGIAPSRFLAKLGSDIDKPDGLQTIDHTNLLDIYDHIGLRDLYGINFRMERRLKEQGIVTPIDFLHADLRTLRAVFRSVVSRDWYLRLRGYEIDNVEFARRSYGQSYVLPSPMDKSAWISIMTKLVDKAARRMRGDGYSARGVHLYLQFSDRSSWARGHTQSIELFDTRDLLSLVHDVYSGCKVRKKVKHIAVSFFDLSPLSRFQLSLTQDLLKKHSLTVVSDRVNNRYGSYTLYPASMLNTKEFVRDTISFGK